MPEYADKILLSIKPGNRKLFAILAPVLAGVVLGGHIVVKPVLKKMRMIEAERSSYSQKDVIYKNIIDWDKKISAVGGEEGKNINKDTLIEQLSSLAGKTGLTIVSISPDEKKIVLSNIEGILVRIEAEGNYHQMAEFISQAESLKLHTRLTSLEINRDQVQDMTQGPTGTPINAKAYKISISLTVYFGTKG